MLSEQELRDIRDRRVVRANELIQRFNNRFTAQQQKIILYLIASIDQYAAELPRIEFSVSDFCQVCGIPIGGRYYQELEADMLAISSTQISATVQDEYGEVKQTNLTWISKYEMYSSGIMYITLDNDMKPYLLQLQERFTQTQLLFSVHFNSKYTLRLYDFICSIHFDRRGTYNSRRFTVSEIRNILGVDSGRYSAYKDFKRYVLMVAVGEINQCSDKQIKLTEIRKGHSTTHIEIEVSSKQLEDRLQAAATAENDLNGKRGAENVG